MAARESNGRDHEPQAPAHWLEALHDAVAADTDADFPRPDGETVPPEQFEAIRDCLRRLEQVRRTQQSSREQPRLAPVREPSPLAGEGRVRGKLSDRPLGDQHVLSAEPRDEDRPKRIGRFEIVGELGRGGHGIVFLAHDPALRRQIALKVPRPEALASPELRRRFLREAHAAARLSHPHIVSVHEVGDAAPVCYIASDYCPGGNLAAHLRAASAPLAPRAAALLVAELAEGVQYAHEQGVLHRDIKPSNVLLAPRLRSAATNGRADEPPEFVPKLTDFGLARLSEQSGDQTKSGTLLGTPAYMAPEQAEGRLADVGPATDVYGLGVVLYELVVGRPPFWGATETDTLRQVLLDEPTRPRRARRELPPDLEAICLKCLEKQPNKRYATAAELAADLRRFLADEPTRARPLGAGQRLLKWARRRPAAAALVGVTISAAIVLGSWGTWYSVQLTRHARELRSALAVAEDRRRAAEASDLQSRRLLYGTDVKLADQAIDGRKSQRAIELLERHIPRSGQEDLREFAWHYLWHLVHGDVATLTGHEGDVYCVDFSPDGRLLASAGRDGTIRLWDLDTHRNVATLRGHDGEVNIVAFAPDGQRFVSCGDDGAVLVWDSARREVVQRIAAHSGSISCAAFSATGQRLATGGGDGQVRLWNTSDWSQQAAWQANESGVMALAFSPDGAKMATLIGQHAFAIWGIAEPSAERMLSLQPELDCVSLAYSPDGSRIVVGFREGMIEVYDAATGNLINADAPHQEAVHSLLFTPDGTELVSVGNDGAVVICDGKNFGTLRTMLGHVGRIWGATLSPDGRLLATAGADRTVKLWDVKYHPASQTIAHVNGNLQDMALSRNGKIVATKVDAPRGVVMLWDLRTRQLQRTLVGGGERSDGLAYSYDDRYLVSASPDPGLSVWEVATGQCTTTVPKDGWCGRPATHPSAPFFATCSKKSIQLWSIPEGRLLAKLTPEMTPYYLSFSSDGELLAAAGEKLQIWNVSGRRRLRSLHIPGNTFTCVEFIPTGRWLVTAGEDLSLRVWNIPSLDPVAILVGCKHHIWDLDVSPDGRTLATIEHNGVVRLWSLVTFQELVDSDAFPGRQYMSGVAFTPDGRALIAAGGVGEPGGFVTLFRTSREAGEMPGGNPPAAIRKATNAAALRGAP